MSTNFYELNEKLKKKELEKLTDEQKEKVSIIKDLFLNENCFFDMEMTVAINILSFLGIPDDKIVDFYFELIKPENYQKIPKVMTSISKN